MDGCTHRKHREHADRAAGLGLSSYPGGVLLSDFEGGRERGHERHDYLAASERAEGLER